MSPKVVKFVAVPATAVLGIASFRVHYAMTESSVEGLLTPHQLSIYTPLPQKFQYVEEKPGTLQSNLGTVRGWLQSYLRAVKGSLLSAKARAVNLYHAGEDVYHYLKDPPPGFLTRAGLISGAGLTGVVLARKGSRLRRVLLPLGLASLGAGICYPAQALALLKVSGRQAWAASQWSASAVSSLWRSEPPAHHATPPPLNPSSPPPPASPSAAPATDLHPSQSRGPQSSGAPVNPASGPAAEDTTIPCSPATPHDSGTGATAIPSSAPAVSEQTAPAVGPLPLPPLPPLTAPAGSTGDEMAVKTNPPAGKPGLTVNPQFMDFGQSNPEDADLYSTRS